MGYVNDVNEETRIAVLCSLSVLDTAEDENLNRIVSLARHIFNVPVAFIALIDEERQWFKSIQGLDLRETKREDSFCTVTIQKDEVMEVLDAANHDFFKNNPYVVGEPGIRYYMGAPITVSGARIGTLCVMGFEPREEASAAKKEILVELAAVAAREISVQQLLREAIPHVVEAVAADKQP